MPLLFSLKESDSCRPVIIDLRVEYERCFVLITSTFVEHCLSRARTQDRAFMAATHWRCHREIGRSRNVKPYLFEPLKIPSLIWCIQTVLLRGWFFLICCLSSFFLVFLLSFLFKYRSFIGFSYTLFYSFAHFSPCQSFLYYYFCSTVLLNSVTAQWSSNVWAIKL